MERKKMLFVYNPRAGKGEIRSKLSNIVEIFTNADYEVTIHATRRKNDATEIVSSCGEKYDIVACSGGDGTLNEVVIGIMNCKKRPVCGYIPTGTTNDCANSLRISKNLVQAANTIVEGTHFPYDIGMINEDYFIYVAGFGAFTDVSYATSQTTKNMFGRLAYILEGVKRIPSLKSYHYRIEYDDQVIDDYFLYGMVSNSNSIGGFKGLGKDVSLNDGVFEVTLIKPPHNAMELQAIINSLLLEDRSSEHIISFHTSHVVFTSDEMVPWTVDGEFGGNLKQVDIQNLKHAISFKVDE